MLQLQVLITAILVTITKADKYTGDYASSPLLKYQFSWGVRDPEAYNDYDHKENRDGDSVQGSYSVLLPDGRKQIVTYYVTPESGYVADVRYENEGYNEQAYLKSPNSSYKDRHSSTSTHNSETESEEIYITKPNSAVSSGSYKNEEPHRNNPKIPHGYKGVNTHRYKHDKYLRTDDSRDAFKEIYNAQLNPGVPAKLNPGIPETSYKIKGQTRLGPNVPYGNEKEDKFRYVSNAYLGRRNSRKKAKPFRKIPSQSYVNEEILHSSRIPHNKKGADEHRHTSESYARDSKEISKETYNHYEPYSEIPSDGNEEQQQNNNKEIYINSQETKHSSEKHNISDQSGTNYPNNPSTPLHSKELYKHRYTSDAYLSKYRSSYPQYDKHPKSVGQIPSNKRLSALSQYYPEAPEPYTHTDTSSKPSYLTYKNDRPKTEYKPRYRSMAQRPYKRRKVYRKRKQIAKSD
ncbi:uncharacterized protein LOC136028014 [Artemia franciscana]